MTSPGRYFEDFKVGEVYKHWPGRTITDFDNTLFTLMTNNTHPVHFDTHYASKTHIGKCLVNGALVFAVGMGLSTTDLGLKMAEDLAYEFIEHTAPVFNGDTLYAQSTVVGLRESPDQPDRGVVTIEQSIRNQDDAEVTRCRRKYSVYKRSSGI